MPRPKPRFWRPGRGRSRYTAPTGAREVRSLMSLPEAALDDPDEALRWARLSLAPARAAAAEEAPAKARKAEAA